MEHNNYIHFITDTVESMLPRFSDPYLVLTMKIDMKWTGFGYDKDGNTKIREESNFIKEYFLAFHRPHNYTKVLFLDVPRPPYNSKYGNIHRILPSAGEFELKLLSDHDSCWRSDGMNWMFDTFVKAWEFFDNGGAEGRLIDPMVGYSMFRGRPEWWLIKKLEKKDPSEYYCREYIIEFDRKVGIHEISNYMKNTQS